MRTPSLQDHDEYREKYDALTAGYGKVKSRLDFIAEEKESRALTRETITRFIGWDAFCNL